MPPSHHNGGSHSSHSSHSSSSHSSSRGPSSHSGSSHYSSSRSVSYGGASSHYSSPKPRVNQPKGCSYTPVTHRCNRHVYHYYNNPWVDIATGIAYKSGYYDENGDYYKGLITKVGDKNLAEFECEYCGKKAKYEWKEGEIPTCSSCAAQMTQVKSFAVDSAYDGGYSNSNNYSYNSVTTLKRNFKWPLIIIGLIFVLNMISGLFGTIMNHSDSYSS